MPRNPRVESPAGGEGGRLPGDGRDTGVDVPPWPTTWWEWALSIGCAAETARVIESISCKFLFLRQYHMTDSKN